MTPSIPLWSHLNNFGVKYAKFGVFGNPVSSTASLSLGSLSSDVFERHTSTGNELLAHLSRDFEQIFGQIVSIRIKTLGNTNTVA